MSKKARNTTISKDVPKVAHKIPGRIRIKLPHVLDDKQTKMLTDDLKASPIVAEVRWQGSSLVIYHRDDDQIMKQSNEMLKRIFPNFEKWSDEVDAKIAKFGANPFANKALPFGILCLAGYTAFKQGALLAGESAFALAYLSFDLYWKFQQENLIKKIEKGLSSKDELQVL